MSCGELAYYSCDSCGLELNNEEVQEVKSARFLANGEWAMCPTCDYENSVERDEYE